MKAAVIHSHGGLDAVKVEDIAEPKVADNEVVLQVRSAALNHLDIWVRNGGRGPAMEMPHILGSDAAGIVLAKGTTAEGINVGDEVIINPGLYCWCCEQCMAGQHSQCESFGIVGFSRPGTFAEKVAVPSYTIWPKPSHLDFNEAAALPLAYVTAWRMLFTRARLLPGETILIHGVGGGVALAALQLAKLAGAEAIVTSSSDEKLAKAKKLGANHTINYKTADSVAKSVKEITNDRGVDIVFDTVGAQTWETDFEAVKKGGRIILCGVTSGAKTETNLQSLYWRQVAVLGSTMGPSGDFRQMLKTVTAAKLKPVIDSICPLNDIQKAMGRMEKGQQFGKIVLTISK
jgi:NADPH:quinone reductase-like Zn-dependent oxidoreductase